MVHRDSPAVTVDRHGLATLFNDREFMGVKQRVDKALYVWSERMFQTTAAGYGLLPADFQAVTWVVWRKNDRSRRLSEMQLPLGEILEVELGLQ